MNIVWTKSLEAEKLSEIKKLFPNLHFVKTIERDSIDADLPQADVFLLTSPSAVRYAKTNYGENFFEGKKAVCFGKKTANLLMDSGAKVERVYADNGEDFYNVVRKNDKLRNQKLAFLGGKVTAFPLVEKLKQDGFDIDSFVLYVTHSIDISDSDKAIISKEDTIICVASPSAVKSIFESGVKIPKSTKFLSIGKTTANAIEKLDYTVIVSKQPNVDSMIESLRDLG